jgi:hypothetical protein
MQPFLKHTIITITILSLLMVPISALAIENADPMGAYASGEMVADGLIVRPLGIVALVTGFGLFIISSPFSALGGNIGEAWDTLVTDPAKFTFARPLGKF